MSPVQLFWTAALVFAALTALTKGGRDERWTALVLLLADVASRVHHPHDLWMQADLISPALDFLLLSYLLQQAMRTTRWWPLYACAAQVCTLISGLAFWTGGHPLLKSYFWASAFWSYAILVALALGTVLEHARIGEDRRLNDFSGTRPTPRARP